MHCTNSVQTINDLLILLIINFSDVILCYVLAYVYNISFNKFPIFHINVRSLIDINIMQKGTESIVLIAKKSCANLLF